MLEPLVAVTVSVCIPAPVNAAPDFRTTAPALVNSKGLLEGVAAAVYWKLVTPAAPADTVKSSLLFA